MGYTRDPALVALVEYRNSLYRSKSPPVIAFLTKWSPVEGWKHDTPKNLFWEGAKDRAHRLGYKLEHFSLGEAGMTAARMSKILLTRNIKGAILANFEHHTKSIELPWDHLCAVRIDYEPLEPELSSITNNQLGAIRLAMRKVRELGYRRIGLCTPVLWEQLLDNIWAIGYLWEQQKLDPKDRIPELRYNSTTPWSRPSASGSIATNPTLWSATPGYHGGGRETRIWMCRVTWPWPTNCGDSVYETAGVKQNHEAVGRLALDIVAGFMSQHKYGLPATPTRSYVDGYWIDGSTCPQVGKVKAGAPDPVRQRAEVQSP